ncbi:c-type cytochrome [Pseudogulbenkiania subflava]|uniref:Cytochrome c5 n=1 Tax=Pseudogulbenkiania subflava DSM 22618 TaxID=1123014 RepID=A0A1Y6BES8_9NEIS|nr:c-type cytochrome [Pseudogulbenkiania subflava]SMF00924.1 Cytochrome c5 [Pseudogulbenkiania subflava DSM 22618]
MSNGNGMAPGQVVKVLIGVVVFLVVAIWLLAKLATSGFNVDAEVMTKEAVAARLKPVGESVASDAPPGMRNGEQVFKGICISCHGTGLAGSPKFGDAGAWAPRIAKGFDTLVQHALGGFNAMPAKGGAADLSDDEVKRAVAYMANAGGAKFTEPKVGGEGGAALDPNVAGKKIFDSVCTACHSTGAAGAPKFGDKAAWAPRLKPGLDEVVKIATKGLNAMPPKGGFTGSDEEFKAAVEYMVNNSK